MELIRANFSYFSSFGQQFPHGNSAVAYLYGPQGTFRELHSVIYEYNYYSQYATPEHPYNKDALIAMSNGTTITTCRDANGHLLLDFNHDGEIDTSTGGSAFFEHNGYGSNTVSIGTPFTNFWFDDNWLTRYLSEAYGRSLPHGLSDYTDFTRWRILSGAVDPFWVPYKEDYFDTLALDGLYYLTMNDMNAANEMWYRIFRKSSAYYNTTMEQYLYPGFTENYHMALFKILTDRIKLIQLGSNDEILQHSVALRAASCRCKSMIAMGILLVGPAALATRTR
jgi:hypothetical protein